MRTRCTGVACRLALLVLGALGPALGAGVQAPDAPYLDESQRVADFNQFCEFVRVEYAYFDVKATAWHATCEALSPSARVARSRDEFVAVLESALSQLYDTHAHLGTNTSASHRLVPTGSQLRLAWREGRAVVTDVRRGSAAAKAGVRVSDELLTIDETAAGAAAAAIEPRHLLREDPAARDWALNVVVAGRHQRATRRLRLRTSAGERDVEYKADDTGADSGLLEFRRMGSVGYVRIHNSLGEAALVKAFDQAIQDLAGVTGLILDLRDTPSGGTSSVARGLLGHFVSAPAPYQRHEYVAEGRETGVPRVWMEYVSPRPALIRAPVVVLVGAWTGSMGEGIAIGLNATRDAPVMGQRMAQLLGALGEVRLMNSGIVVRVPNEKLFHVNGKAREAFTPQDVAESPPADTTLQTALRLLQ